MITENMPGKMAVHIIMCFICFIMSGCAVVGPDYKTITPDVPLNWHSGLANGLTLSPGQDDHMALAQWWTFLKDPVLEQLEQETLRNNLNLKQAFEKINEARALRGISVAGLFPVLDGKASVTKSRSSENAGTGTESNFYRAGLDAGWELDLFGGVRRKIEAADADLEGLKYSYEGVMVSLTAEVGLNYVDVRTFQARLKAAQSNLAAQQHTFDLNQSRYQAGLIDELAVQQSLYNLEQTRSLIPQLKNGLSTSMNRLAVLIGKKPGNLEKKLYTVRSVPQIPLSIVVKVPAEAMRQRPDVRQAERELAAATARIGVAKADLYPKFSLTGSLSLESMTMGNLSKWGSHTFSAGPSISWNLFDANAIRRNIDVQDSRTKQALIHYKSTVLDALEEVENALDAFAREQERRKALFLATRAANRAVVVAEDSFNAGLIDFSNVLDAQRSLLSFQDELVVSEGNVISDVIRLYKALGGGWSSNDLQGRSRKTGSDSSKNGSSCIIK